MVIFPFLDGQFPSLAYAEFSDVFWVLAAIRLLSSFFVVEDLQ